jgi:transmembrane sensor
MMKKQMPVDQSMSIPADLRQQAWEWLRLLNSGKATVADGDRFRSWLVSDPLHKNAYAAAKSQWKVVTSATGTWRQAGRKVATVPSEPLRPPVWTRRAFLGTAMGAAAAAGVAVVVKPPLGLWPTPSEWGADYRTATGEQRTVAMASHVQVTLNTQTSIRRDTSAGGTAGVELVSGELAVDLAQGGQPFAVTAGAGRSAADSGQFEVRNLDGKVCVTCIEGIVRVAHPAGDRLLRAREQAVYDDGAISGTASIDAAAVTAWRNGMLVLHEVRLVDAIDEINRYRAGRVILMSAATRDRRVTGSFPIASMDQTVRQLQHVFGLKSRALGGVLLLS